MQLRISTPLSRRHLLLCTEPLRLHLWRDAGQQWVEAVFSLPLCVPSDIWSSDANAEGAAIAIEVQPPPTAARLSKHFAMPAHGPCKTSCTADAVLGDIANAFRLLNADGVRTIAVIDCGTACALQPLPATRDRRTRDRYVLFVQNSDRVVPFLPRLSGARATSRGDDMYNISTIGTTETYSGADIFAAVLPQWDGNEQNVDLHGWPLTSRTKRNRHFGLQNPHLDLQPRTIQAVHTEQLDLAKVSGTAFAASVHGRTAAHDSLPDFGEQVTVQHDPSPLDDIWCEYQLPRAYVHAARSMRAGNPSAWHHLLPYVSAITQPRPPFVQRQRSKLCMLHALNNALQCPILAQSTVQLMLQPRLDVHTGNFNVAERN